MSPARIPDATVAAWRRDLAAGSTIRDVAQRAGVDPSTVRRRVGPLDRRSGPKPLTVTVADVVTAYERTGSYRATATHLGVSLMVVRNRLWQAGRIADPTGRNREPPSSTTRYE